MNSRHAHTTLNIAPIVASKFAVNVAVAGGETIPIKFLNISVNGEPPTPTKLTSKLSVSANVIPIFITSNGNAGASVIPIKHVLNFTVGVKNTANITTLICATIAKKITPA